VLILAMMAALFSGCMSSKDNKGGTNNGGGTSNTNNTSGTNNSNSGGTGSSDKGDSGKPEEVVITYVNWNLGTEAENNIERQMIQAFQDAYPNIKVQLDESFDYSKYGDSLIAAAAAGKLPDVIMLPNIPFGLSNEWLLNLNDLAANDPEWQFLPKTLEEATHYGSGIYAIPAGMFFMGYFINQDLFEQANLPELDFAPTWDDFANAIRTLNNPSEGIIGLAEEVQIPEWYPASVNSELGWYTWDGEKYRLDDPSFTEGVNKARELFQGKYTYDSLSDEQKAQYNAGWFGDVWNQGKIAVRWDGTWATRDYSTRNFKSKFIGVPGGRFVLVGDFMGISKSSAHPEEAYTFAKFMTFGKEGILKRIELNTDGSYTSLPLTTDTAVLEQYFASGAYPGIEEAFNQIDNAIVEGVKIVPGYVRSRWEAPTGVKIGDKDNANLADLIFNSMRGNVRIEDYIGQINKLANDEYKAAAESIAELTK
jgi:multiple sugar transport system substrate-binding protein